MAFTKLGQELEKEAMFGTIAKGIGRALTGGGKAMFRGGVNASSQGMPSIGRAMQGVGLGAQRMATAPGNFVKGFKGTKNLQRNKPFIQRNISSVKGGKTRAVNQAQKIKAPQGPQRPIRPPKVPAVMKQKPVDPKAGASGPAATKAVTAKPPGRKKMFTKGRIAGAGLGAAAIGAGAVAHDTHINGIYRNRPPGSRRPIY